MREAHSLRRHRLPSSLLTSERRKSLPPSCRQKEDVGLWAPCRLCQHARPAVALLHKKVGMWKMEQELVLKQQYFPEFPRAVFPQLINLLNLHSYLLNSNESAKGTQKGALFQSCFPPCSWPRSPAPYRVPFSVATQHQGPRGL